MTFFPMLPSVNKNPERESNPMPKPLYLYQSRSAFLDGLTDPTKHFFSVKSMFKFLNYGLSM